MVYFYLAVYFLVNILIQDGVAQGTKYGYIWSNATTVSPGEAYNITCKSRYTFWLLKNNTYITSHSCSFDPRVTKTDYICSNETRGGFNYIDLTILMSESSPTSVKWTCFYPTVQRSISLNIKVSNDPSRTTRPKTTSTHKTTPGLTSSRQQPSTTLPRPTTSRRRPTTTTPRSTPSRQPTTTTPRSTPSPWQPTTTTPRSTPSPRKPIRTSSSSSSSSSSKDLWTPNKPPAQGPNIIIIIAIGVAAVVLVVLIIVVAVMCLRSKRKQNRAKQGPLRPQAQAPLGFAAEGNYDSVDTPSPPQYDWSVTDADFGSPYDTAEAVSKAEVAPESSNPNFDDSKMYGVVHKKKPSEEEAGPSNPNFDPDKVYGVVDKSAKCQ